MELKPGYKQTEVGVIPEDWQVKALHTIAKIQSGIAKNSNISVNNPILVHYLRVANVQDGFLDLTDMSKIEVSRNDLKRYEVLPGDVLMNEGGDLDKLGRGSIWHGEFNPCVHQNHVFVVRCRSYISPEYLNTWTSGTSARRYFLVAGKQTTNLATINKTALGQLPVALPSPPEQKAIATALSDIDNLLGVLDRLIAKKQNLKQAAMQELLTGKKRLPGFSGEWEEKVQKSFAKYINGRAYKRSEWEKNGIPVVRLQNLTGSGQEYYYSTLNLPEQQYMDSGDLIFMWSASFGPFIWKLGKAIYHYHIWKIEYNKSQIDKLFYFYKLYELTKVIKEQSDGSTMLHLTKNKMENYKLNFPPTLSEQKAIANILSDMDTEIAALKKRRDKTQNIKQAMMQELLTGKTRLVEPGDTN